MTRNDVFLLILVFLFSAVIICLSPNMAQKPTLVKDLPLTLNGPEMLVTRFEHDGHTYIYFQGKSKVEIPFSILHDPDCKLCSDRRQAYLNQVSSGSIPLYIELPRNF